jgi:hypothetical protein
LNGSGLLGFTLKTRVSTIVPKNIVNFRFAFCGTKTS